MKRPCVNTKQLFAEIIEKLKKEGKTPDILDYAIATSSPVDIRSYEFEIKTNLQYGGSEGIYLDCSIEGTFGPDEERIQRQLGTIKTLVETDDAMYTMAKLLADFYLTGVRLVNADLDRFERKYFKIKCYDENGRYTRGLCGFRTELEAKNAATREWANYPGIYKITVYNCESGTEDIIFSK